MPVGTTKNFLKGLGTSTKQDAERVTEAADLLMEHLGEGKATRLLRVLGSEGIPLIEVLKAVDKRPAQ